MPKRYTPADIDALIERILVDAHGEDEGMTAFYEEFRSNVPLPQDAFVLGQPLSVHEVDYDGNVLAASSQPASRKTTRLTPSVSPTSFFPRRHQRDRRRRRPLRALRRRGPRVRTLRRDVARPLRVWLMKLGVSRLAEGMGFEPMRLSAYRSSKPASSPLEYPSVKVGGGWRNRTPCRQAPPIFETGWRPFSSTLRSLDADESPLLDVRSIRASLP